MSGPQISILITLTGRDRPGVTSRLFTVLAAHELTVDDVEQVVIRGKLVLGALLTAGAAPDLTAIHREVAAIAGRIAADGANIDRIGRLADRPVTCIELEVSGSDPDRLRTALARESLDQRADVAVQRGGLHRRAMRLVMMDVDSTLVDGEVIDLL